MVTPLFPPYAASAGWYARWLGSIIEEEARPANAIASANRMFPTPRFLARTFIRPRHGEELMLSIAIEGGARKLRDFSYKAPLTLSHHGNWRRTHPLALEAAYGKTPFFPHFAPLLNEIYFDSALTTLELFNSEFHKAIADFLFGSLSMHDILRMGSKSLILKRGEELSGAIDRDISIIDALMKFGPETIFAIFALSF